MSGGAGRGGSRRALLALLLLGCAACGVPAGGPPAAGPEAEPAVRVESAPEWRPGDRWVYEWTSGDGTGVKTVEVTDLRRIRDAEFYVLRIGDLEHFYTRQLGWAASARAQRVDSRITPPLPWFAWPLEAGLRWAYSGVFEQPGVDAAHPDVRARTDRFAVAGVEAVEVPAGRFRALHLTREDDGGDRDDYWYTPEVRFYARWVGRRGGSQFEERLREYHAAPRTAGAVPAR